MGSRKDDMGPLSQYNSLTDPNLQAYYSKQIVRSHLRLTGLINRKGEIIPDEVWRKRILTKEKMQQASRLIAQKIVQQAIEIKNLERAEIKKKLEEVSKRELVRRMRGQSAQSRQLPLLWGGNAESRPLSDTRRRTDSRSLSPRTADDGYGDIRLVDDADDGHRRRLHSGKPPRSGKYSVKNRLKRQRNKSKGLNSRFRSVYQPKPEYEPTMVTMIYYGKGINIPYDTQVFDPKDEISIMQQHCGGENLCVFSGFLEAGDKFTWKSKRHKEYPFSVSIYINGTFDCRISTCCEYRHSLNVRIGGKTGRFGITNVVGGQACVKCLLERATKEKNKVREEEDEKFEEEDKIVVITEKPTSANQERDSREQNEFRNLEVIPLNHGTTQGEYDTDGFDDETERSNWKIIFHTNSKKLTRILAEDASVRLKIIGKLSGSEVLTLDKMDADNFLSGKTETFNIQTANIGEPTHVILNLKEKEPCHEWNLQKIMLTDLSNSINYKFPFNGIVTPNKSIKIPLDTSSDTTPRANIIEVSSSRDPWTAKSSSRRSSSSIQDFVEESPRRKEKSPVQKSINQRRSSSDSLNGANKAGKSKRLLANDVVNELKHTDSFIDSSKNFSDEDTSTESYKAPKPTESARVSSRQSNASINKTKPEPSKMSSRKSSSNSIAKLNTGEWLVKIFTSDLKGVSMEGTDANVYIALIGYDNHECEKVWLSKQIAKSNNKDLFEAGKCDDFLVSAPNVKKLKKIRIGIDNSGFGAGWHLHKVEIIDQRDGTRYFFECNKWLSKDEDDGAIERILIADEDDDTSSTKSSSSSTISSSSGISKVIFRKSKTPSAVNSTKSSRNSSPSSKQKLTRLTGQEVGDLLDKKSTKDADTSSASERSDNSYLRKLKSPVKTTERERETPHQPPKPTTKSWLVKVYTSDLKGKAMEGTDANVYISLIGPNGNETGNIMLDKQKAKSKNKDLFETGQCDEFTITTQSDINNVKKIRIGHDNKGLGSGWHLNKVEVVDQETKKTNLFKCNLWLDKKEGDGKIERILDRDTMENEDSSSDSLTPVENNQRSKNVLSPTQKSIPKEKPKANAASKQSSLFEDSDDTQNFSDDSENSLFGPNKDRVKKK